MKHYITVTLVAAFCVCILLSGCGAGKSGRAQVLIDTEISLSHQETEKEGIDVETKEEASEEIPETAIYVHVCGAVNVPGVYTLPASARVFDAIAAAGGFAGDAAKDICNQAEQVADGQKIYIPTTAEAEESPGLYSCGEPRERDSRSAGKININRADLQELQTIPGIGETKASAIIADRDEQGMFRSVDELTRVSGIGEGTLARIREYITVE